MSNKKYRPSNETESEIFMAEWCSSCAHHQDENEDYCEILGLTFALCIDDPDYPPQWTYDENAVHDIYTTVKNQYHDAQEQKICSVAKAKRCNTMIKFYF